MDEITPDAPGWSWEGYFTKEGLQEKVMCRDANYQDLPDKVPEVKGYTGGDHMQCNMDEGR